jgi:hypothetical protein
MLDSRTGNDSILGRSEGAAAPVVASAETSDAGDEGTGLAAPFGAVRARARVTAVAIELFMMSSRS